MSEISISVIIPVYNVEDYIERAVDSIRDQTFKNWEMILVDDGSPDSSGLICDALAREDDRIRVIHQDNTGAAGARNHAIGEASGKYLYFMDADDWCLPGMLEDLYENAERYNAEYVVCGYYIDTYYGDGENDYVSTPVAPDSFVFYDTAAAFRKDAHKYFDRNLLYTPWNKLYLASVIRDNGLTFPKTQWDDFPFNLSVIAHVNRVVVSPEKYYHFLRARSESESEKYIPGLYEKREEEHGWMIKLYRSWNASTNPGIIKDEAVREFVSRRYIERLFGCFENLTNPRAPKRDITDLFLTIDSMLSNPRVDVTLRYARPRSWYMKVMLFPVRMKFTPVIYLQTRIITLVKTRFIRLFAFLKSHR